MACKADADEINKWPSIGYFCNQAFDGNRLMGEGLTLTCGSRGVSTL